MEENEEHLARMDAWGLSLIEAEEEQERRREGLEKTRIDEDVLAAHLSKVLKNAELDASKSGIVTREGLDQHAAEVAEAERRRAAAAALASQRPPPESKPLHAQSSMAKRVDLAVMRAAASSMRNMAVRLLFVSKPVARDRWVIDPDSRTHFVLEHCRVVCALYTVFAEPSLLALSQTQPNWRESAPGASIFFSTMCDVFFLMDLCVSPFKGYMWLQPGHGWQPELHFERTWRKYLKSWFILDLFCVPPVQLILWATDHKVRGFDILLILSLLKLTALLRIWSYLGTRHKLKWYRLVHMTKAVLLWLASTHWVACFWLMHVFHVPAELTDPSSGNSLDECADRFALLGSSSSGRQYVCSIYFTTQTFLLAGFGDIVPHTRGERVFVVLLILFGVLLLFKIVVSVVQIRGKDKEELLYEEMSRIVKYMQRQKVLDDVIQPVQDFYQFRWDTYDGYYDLEQIRQLPSQLRVKTFLAVYKELLAAHHLLSLKGEKDTRFWTLFIASVEEYTYLSDDIIARFDDPPSRLYFLRHGVCHEIHPPYQNLLLREHRAPAWFGELEALTGQQRRAAIQAKSQCNVLEMSWDGIQRLSDHFPDFGQVLERVCITRLHRVNAIRLRAIIRAHRAELHDMASLLPQPPPPWPKRALPLPSEEEEEGGGEEEGEEGGKEEENVAHSRMRRVSFRAENEVGWGGAAREEEEEEREEEAGARSLSASTLDGRKEVGMEEEAGEEWREYSDDETGEHYFHCRRTGETLWEWQYVERYLLPGQPAAGPVQVQDAA